MAKKYKSLKKCSVAGGLNKSSDSEISFHLFPSDKNLSEQWKEACDITKNKVKGLYICSSHFKQNDYFCNLSYKKTNKKFLKKNAIPVIRLKRRSVPIILKRAKTISCSMKLYKNQKEKKTKLSHMSGDVQMNIPTWSNSTKAEENDISFEDCAVNKKVMKI